MPRSISRTQTDMNKIMLDSVINHYWVKYKILTQTLKNKNKVKLEKTKLAMLFVEYCWIFFPDTLCKIIWICPSQNAFSLGHLGEFQVTWCDAADRGESLRSLRTLECAAAVYPSWACPATNQSTWPPRHAPPTITLSTTHLESAYLTCLRTAAPSHLHRTCMHTLSSRYQFPTSRRAGKNGKIYDVPYGTTSCLYFEDKPANKS